MITLSNGHSFEYMIASGGLAFDGKGYLWEKPFVWFGIIDPTLFTVVLKTLTRHKRPGNLRWCKPWECVKLIDGGAVNKVGLTNKGIEWWCKNIGPYLDFQTNPLVGSIYGTQDELVEMAEMLNTFDLVGLEVNSACPNSGAQIHVAETVVSDVRAVRKVSRHPLIVKVSVAQDYVAIACGLEGVAEAISINSVPWEIAFPNERSPLWRLEKKVGGGGGGVSGILAQKFNWQAVRVLAKQGSLPVIGSSIMDFKDMDIVRSFGASAVSFATIHLPTKGKPWTLFTNPWKPTEFVKIEQRLKNFQKEN